MHGGRSRHHDRHYVVRTPVPSVLTGTTSSALGSKSYGMVWYHTWVPSTTKLNSTAKDENPYAALILETSSDEEGSKPSEGVVPVLF
jgi:hypothetical protein